MYRSKWWSWSEQSLKHLGDMATNDAFDLTSSAERSVNWSRHKNKIRLCSLFWVVKKSHRKSPIRKILWINKIQRNKLRYFNSQSINLHGEFYFSKPTCLHVGSKGYSKRWHYPMSVPPHIRVITAGWILFSARTDCITLQFKQHNHFSYK